MIIIIQYDCRYSTIVTTCVNQHNCCHLTRHLFQHADLKWELDSTPSAVTVATCRTYVLKV